MLVGTLEIGPNRTDTVVLIYLSHKTSTKNLNEN